MSIAADKRSPGFGAQQCRPPRMLKVALPLLGVAANAAIAAPTLSLSATPTTIVAGGTTSVAWTSSGTTQCMASGAWGGKKSTSGTARVRLYNSGVLYMTCKGASGQVQKNVAITVSAPTPAPTLSFSATPASILAGASTTLSWSSSNATSCTAAGGWSGAKASTGSEVISKLLQSAVFDLTCSGAGGSVQRSVPVAVSTPPPTLTFTGAPLDVPVNGTSQLTWSSSNATACTASGAWGGSRPLSGSAQIGPLAASDTFVLACSGTGGSVQSTVTIAVSGPAVNAGLSGSVDSSLIDIRGDNQIYVFSGAVTPHDTQGGSGDALFKLPVTQDANACTFGYALPSLAAGTYTLAFTSQAQNDRPTAADALPFIGTKVITVTSTQVRNDFAPAKRLQVGPTRTYHTIAAAAAAASAGTVIEVDAGDYPDDIVVWYNDNVVVRGVGGRPVVRGTQLIEYVAGDDRRNGKGLWVVDAARMRIENFELSGARVSDGNGAGIRNEGRDLTVCNSYLHDNEDGFLGGAYGRLTIEYSSFANNGVGDGQTHNIYVDAGSASGDQLVFRYNESHHARIGHTLKTRARENFILYNRLMDEQDGTSSYAIDVPNGGATYVIGNLIQQGPNTDNSDVVEYGAEGLASGRVHELYMVNNTLVNDRGSGTFVRVNGSTSVFRATNNLFIGSGTLFSGKQPQVLTNLQAPATTLLDAANYDYRLRADSSAINAGSAPGVVNGVDLTPLFQYVAPAKRVVRTAAGALDVGAYEVAP